MPGIQNKILPNLVENTIFTITASARTGPASNL
jgi:hypothetical protein